MSEDPKGFDAGDYNLFRYCHNDPIDLTDPMGLMYGSTAGQHLTPEILDYIYGKAMAAAQWVGSDLMHASTAAGAIGIGVTGEFNATHVQWKETGNWTDRKIANHYVKEALYVKGKPAGGKTVGKVTAYANKDASVTAEVNVNWYVQQKYAGTDVVTRELDHVQDWRDWTNAAKNAIFLSFANANKSYGSTEQLAGAVQEYLTPRTKEFAETQWWRYDRGGGPHDLNYYPAQPAQVPEYDPTH